MKKLDAKQEWERIWAQFEKDERENNLLRNSLYEWICRYFLTSL
jgi:hypothetical protein